MMLAALALREEIGEPAPGEAPTVGDRRLCYAHALYATSHVLTDPPMRDYVEENALRELLHVYDGYDARPADVVGPLFVDHDRALALADKHGVTVGDHNLARAEIEELAHRNWVIVAVGAHWAYPE